MAMLPTPPVAPVTAAERTDFARRLEGFHAPLYIDFILEGHARFAELPGAGAEMLVDVLTILWVGAEGPARQAAGDTLSTWLDRIAASDTTEVAGSERLVQAIDTLQKGVAYEREQASAAEVDQVVVEDVLDLGPVARRVRRHALVDAHRLAPGGAVELAEEVFHMPVRLGTPQYVAGLVDVVRNPIYATGVGLLLFGNQETATAAQPGRFDSPNSLWERMKNWFHGSF